MSLHPGQEQRHVPEEKRGELDSTLRVRQDREDWYQDLVRHSDDLLCIHDLAGRLLSVNPAPARVLGYSVEELLKIPMRELVAPEYRSRFDAYLAAIEREGEANGYLAVMTRSGARRIWQYHNTLRTEGVASPIVRGIAHDVTEQKRTEKLLREAGEDLLGQVRERERTIQDLKLFRTLVDQCNDAIEVVDPNTLRFLDVNEKACSVLGYSREEFLSLRVFDINPSITESSVEKVREELQKSGVLVRETHHRRKDGSTFPVEVSMRWVRLERDYVIIICRDLSEHKQAERRLREYERLVEGLEEMIVVVNRDYRYVIANRAFLDYRGAEKDQVVGHHIEEVVNREAVAAVKQKLDACFQGKVVEYEMKYGYPDRGERDLFITYFPIEGPTGVDRIAAIMRDVTERKRAEEVQREYERVVEGVSEIILVVDRQYRCLHANRSYLHYRGANREAVIGHFLPELVGKDLFETTIKEKMDECFEGKVVRFEKKYKFASLGERDVFVSYFPVEGRTGVDRVACIMQDVTEYKQSREALRESERTQKLILDHLSVGVILSSVDEERAVYQNPKFLELFGYSIESFPTVADWWPLAYPDPEYREWVSQEWKRRMAEAARTHGEIEPMEVTVTCHDGSKKYVRVLAKVIGDLNFITFVDLSERKQAEEALRHNEDNYRMFVSQSSEGIFRQDLDGPLPIDLPEDELVRHILHDSYLAECNEAIVKMYGLNSVEEFVGKRMTETLDPNDPRNIELTRDYIRSGFRVLDRESHEMDTYGNPRVFLNSLIGIVENGKLVRTWGIQRDVTEKVKLEEARHKAEEALRESEQRFRVALDGSPIKVFNQDRDLRYTWVYNPQEGWSEQDYLGKTDEEIFDTATAARMTALKRPVLETGRGARQEFAITARGQTHYCDVTVEPLRDAGGAVVGVNCACIDVTHLRQVTEELREAKEKLSEEKLYLEHAIDTELGFGEIIGRSATLKEVMSKVAKVAPSDATVLLLGETGTGKELVARAIHRMSKRKDNSFIKLNCAAIPSGLLESELFGHEKGAFTGAVAKKLGRLELADHGTLFLDEIGEIPLDLQPKLLRVLQDQEFERLGGTQTLKVNFRLLAATNRDLPENVKRQEFRSDLYYRLNVFPVRVPPLRDRREDIPLLIEHFVRKCAARMNKSITRIPARTMETLVQWAWPGNIRELENFVERSVILTPGSVLQVPLSELIAPLDERNSDTLRDKDRERIIRTLRECNGQLGGPDGAAARLGLKRTTLQSKLIHLGIDPGSYRA